MKTLIIEIRREAGQWKLSSFYKSDMMAHRQYSAHKVAESSVEEISSDIFNVLSRADIRGMVTADSAEELRKSAALLYDQVFSPSVKDEIRRTDATHIVFYLDEQLVHIPWELLHDGSGYLCLRFAIGRVVLTSQQIHSGQPRGISSKLKMLAVCDPTGVLKKSYEEGIIIRNELDMAKDRVRVDLRTMDVDLKYVLKNIREYDIFHFAGHAQYDETDNSKSVLMLKGGGLTAEKVAALSGSPSMPTLVFANACNSGETEGWRVGPAEENRIYGLANSFLMAGVRHYIGTFWKVEDNLSMNFAKTFYRNIRLGKSIGEAVRLARLGVIEKYGQNALIWASYMLYGDPAEYLLSLKEEDLSGRKRRAQAAAVVFAILFAAGIFLAVRLTAMKDEKPGLALESKPFKNVFYVRQNGAVEEYAELDIFNRNIALGRPMRSSSVEKEWYVPQFAADHNLGTRWSSGFSDPQWIYVDLGETNLIGQIRLIWQTAFARAYRIQVSDDAKKWKTVWRTSHGSADSNVIDLRGRNVYGRYVRVFCDKRGTKFGDSLFEFEVYSDLLPNAALRKTAFASSAAGEYNPGRAVDGDLGTRWGSASSADPQWIYADLGGQYKINMLTVDWEDAFARFYKVQRSDDAKNWIDVCEIHNKKKRESNIFFEAPFYARYVRICGIERASVNWGYSIWELEIYGTKQRRSP